MTPHCAEGFFYHHWHRCFEGIYCCVRCWIIAPDQETEPVVKLEDVPSESASLAPTLLADPRFRYEPPELVVAALALLAGILAGLEELIQVSLPQ